MHLRVYIIEESKKVAFMTAKLDEPTLGREKVKELIFKINRKEKFIRRSRNTFPLRAIQVTQQGLRAPPRK